MSSFELFGACALPLKRLPEKGTCLANRAFDRPISSRSALVHSVPDKAKFPERIPRILLRKTVRAPYEKLVDEVRIVW